MNIQIYNDTDTGIGDTGFSLPTPVRTVSPMWRYWKKIISRPLQRPKSHAVYIVKWRETLNIIYII